MIVEFWDHARWRRVDPEFLSGGVDFDPENIATGPTAPFQTAAQAWQADRHGETDASLCCVFPGSTLSGPDLIRADVIFDVAHRQKDELLLWDGWDMTNSHGDDDTIDDLATLVLRADSGDPAAEEALATSYRDDHRLRPPEVVTQYSPFGDPPQPVRLRSLPVTGRGTAGAARTRHRREKNPSGAGPP